MLAATVDVCTVDDAAGIARNNMSAYWTDTTWKLNFKDRELEDIIVQCTKRIPTNLLNDRATKRHQKVVDTQTGTVIGYARWIMPDRLTGDWLEAQAPEVSKEEEKEFMEQFCSADWMRQPDRTGLGQPLADIMERLLRAKDYIELEYLAVHPDYQRQGVASLLVESGIAVSEKLGVDLIVMAYKAAVGVYKRLGFEMLEFLIQDDSKFGGGGEFGAYFMARKAKKE
ncbi:hypothetical protein BKA67DRAFT_695810 [Truncatella angustata]|uniref:N-acetyltransferase domain-containing protein n=1 Tax=Truncatella angustata TaxID=152316 RepID=A0A9P8RH08_9PEZI|nr:uncharacterized protein BKA67DRAFT_695810 [Truncatella angustata]KAH6645858.1 hypothetical protein BKA67DRAFT_695810 [Truncatella angustata]KAH8201976.1 hypothetical protein TruAng_003819 [Truncatella angustata]